MTQSSLVDSIHQFWFGTNSYGTLPLEKVRLWFIGEEASIEHGGALDYIERHFLFQIKSASGGGMTDWQQNAHGSLALILLLDQFPRLLSKRRTLNRDCQRYALRYCKAGLHADIGKLLTPVELCCFYSPLLYSRNAHDRQHAIRLLEKLLEQTRAEEHPHHEQHGHVRRSLFVAIEQSASRHKYLSPPARLVHEPLLATV
ncbi:MAG: DUF924 family protein [Pseudomonadales bacterium]